jgi:hypothetical protein
MRLRSLRLMRSRGRARTPKAFIGCSTETGSKRLNVRSLIPQGRAEDVLERGGEEKNPGLTALGSSEDQLKGHREDIEGEAGTWLAEVGCCRFSQLNCCHC